MEFWGVTIQQPTKKRFFGMCQNLRARGVKIGSKSGRCLKLISALHYTPF